MELSPTPIRRSYAVIGDEVETQVDPDSVRKLNKIVDKLHNNAVQMKSHSSLDPLSYSRLGGGKARQNSVINSPEFGSLDRKRYDIYEHMQPEKSVKELLL